MKRGTKHFQSTTKGLFMLAIILTCITTNGIAAPGTSCVLPNCRVMQTVFQLQRTYFGNKAMQSVDPAVAAAYFPGKPGLATLSQSGGFTVTQHFVEKTYVPGTAFYLRYTDDTTTYSMDIGNVSNQAQTWTLPAMTYVDSATFDNVPISLAVGTAVYPQTTHATRLEDPSGLELYEYYEITDDSVLVLGEEEYDPVSGFSDFYDLDYLFTPLPLNHGATWVAQDTYAFDPPLGVADGKMSMFTYLSVEGFGTLNTPEEGSVAALKVSYSKYYRKYHDGVLVDQDSVRGIVFYSEQGHRFDALIANGSPDTGLVQLSDIIYEKIIPSKCGKDGYEPNDRFTTASNLFGGVVSGFNNMFICPQGDEDIHRLDLNESKTLQIRLENLPDDYDLEVRDANGMLVAVSDNWGTQSEYIQYSANPGTYYIKVYGYDGAHSPYQGYKLVVNQLLPSSGGTKPDPKMPILKSEPTKVQLDVYPNPSVNGNVMLDFDREVELKKVKIMDLSGKVVFDQHIYQSTKKHTLNPELTIPGVYSLQLITNEGVFSEKLIIQYGE